MDIRFNTTYPKDYLSLLARSDNPVHSEEAAIIAIKNSLFTVGIYHEEELLAFGRVCGDDSLCYVVCDVMVDKAYEKSNLVFTIMKEIDEYLKTVSVPGCQIIFVGDRALGDTARVFRFTNFDEDFYAVMKRR